MNAQGDGGAARENGPLCERCGRELIPGENACRQCGAPVTPVIPNYPRFGGGIFMLFWIFFLVLIVLWIISLVTF